MRRFIERLFRFVQAGDSWGNSLDPPSFRALYLPYRVGDPTTSAWLAALS